MADTNPRPTVLVADSSQEHELLGDEHVSSDDGNESDESSSTATTAGMSDELPEAMAIVGLHPYTSDTRDSFTPLTSTAAAPTQGGHSDPATTQVTQPAMPTSMFRPNLGGIPAEPPKGTMGK